MIPTITDTGLTMRPDHSRVVTRLFVAGREDVGPGETRATPVMLRVLGLDEDEVAAAMRDIDERFGSRHRALHKTFLEHADIVSLRVQGATDNISDARRLLLGAAFTHEFAIEGAALCNPSGVLFPDEGGDGYASFIISVRGVGEGHRSSIGFRTGTVTAGGAVTLDTPAPFPVIASAQPALHHCSVFYAKLAEFDDASENAAFVLDPLAARFEESELTERIDALSADAATRRNTGVTISNLRLVANSSYRVEFPSTASISERVLWPQTAAEAHGMEDARFVRFIGDDGKVTYYATYTAFDGVNIAQHLLETHDFRSFEISPMAGAAARGKGLALFPRKVHGRFVALSRSDRENNAIAFSDDIRCWQDSQLIQTPTRPWELLQLGNCGSPIETEAGWLVLTHGVGAMRTYALGVLLLDLDEPQRVIASSDLPIISPPEAHRDGYVPNVVYSCGAFAHGDVLVLPYGVSDQSIAVATLSITELLASLQYSTPT